MKIKSIYIDGLHNAVNKTYQFGDIVYLFGNNGAGKSTVLQAIQFALLGYIPGTAKNSREAILRHSPKEEITVKLELDDVTITRKMSKSANRTDIDPVTYDISALTKDIELPIFNFNDFVGQTANKLKEYFIKNILPTTNGELNWKQILEESISDCNFQDRDKIIEYGMELLGNIEGDALEQVIKANSIFKEDQSFNKSELQRLQNTIDSLIYYDDYTGPTNMSELNANLLSLNAIRDQMIRYNSAISATQTAKDELERLEKDINGLGGKANYDKLVSILAQLKQHNITLSESISKKNEELISYRAADSAASSIINSGGVCPYTKESCKSIISKIDSLRNDAVSRKAEILELTAELENLNIDLNNTQKSIRQCESGISDFQTLWNRIVTIQKTLGELPEKPNTDKTLEELDLEIAKLSESKEKLQANIRYNETINDITNLKYETELRLQALSAWVKKTDTNGLQTTLMVKPFEELADLMTSYIRNMYDRNDIKAKFTISTKANSFSFGLIRNNVYIPYDMLSSGEKCLYSLALMICIINNSKSSLKLMLCDDMFDHLDSKSIETTFESLKRIDGIQFIFAGVKDCESAKDVMIKVGS